MYIFIVRLNSGIFRIFELSEWNLNLNSWNCGASKIMPKEAKPIPTWELDIKNQTFIGKTHHALFVYLTIAIYKTLIWQCISNLNIIFFFFPVFSVESLFKICKIHLLKMLKNGKNIRWSIFCQKLIRPKLISKLFPQSEKSFFDAPPDAET